MLTEKDIPTVEGVEPRTGKKLDYTWEVSGLYTLPHDGFIGSPRKGIEVKAGDLFVECWRVDEEYESGAREGFIKSVEHRYVHVPTGTACDQVNTNFRMARDSWVDKRGEKQAIEWEKCDQIFNLCCEEKRMYKKRMPKQHKVECECGCECAVDNCDEAFGRHEA